MSKSNIRKFEEAFSKEVYLNERFRLIVITAIFGMIILYLTFLLIFFKEWFDQIFKNQNPLFWLILLLAFFALRSLVVRKIWGRWYKKDYRLPEIVRYLNAALEVSIPTIALIILGLNYPSTILLHTPIVFLYLLFIILSIFELEFKLCIFSGSLAAIEYIVLVFVYTGNASQSEIKELIILSQPFFYIGKAILIFISGILCALATKLIKTRMYNSFAAVEERNNIERLFGQQVSAEVVDELLNNKDEVAGKQQFVCIMFLDIRGFTPLVENKKPEEIIQLQNKIFSFMIAIITKHQGIINQFMGDGFMATFGAPVSTENDCQNAVNAALQIYDELRQKINQEDLPNIKIGMGLHAGQVVTGNVGTAVRKQYSVTGNTVILASRIEQLNKKFDSTILISKEVLEKIQLANYKSLGEVEIKGRHKPIEIFQVV